MDLDHCEFPVEQIEWLSYGGDDLFMTRAKDGVRVWLDEGVRYREAC